MRFAAAANMGVLYSKNDLILLLNNDVKPSKKVRSELVEHFTDPLVFGVGCLEYERNKDGEKSGKNKLWFERGLFMHSKADDMFSGKTAWVSGGSGMFDKEKWMFLNGFDKRFILHTGKTLIYHLEPNKMDGLCYLINKQLCTMYTNQQIMMFLDRKKLWI